MPENSRGYILALPTYNEEESIETMIQRCRSCGIPVFVVDGDSEDSTREKALSMGIKVFQRGEYGNGYGGGIMKAMEVASGMGYEFLGMMDCDTTYFPEDLLLLEEFIHQNDMVVGVRPFANIGSVRRLGNWIHTMFGRLIFGRRIRDINSGMRIIRIEKFRGYVKARDFSMMPRMYAFALRNGLRIKEVPVRYGERTGSSKLSLWSGFPLLWAIAAERFRKRVN